MTPVEMEKGCSREHQCRPGWKLNCGQVAPVCDPLEQESAHGGEVGA